MIKKRVNIVILHGWGLSGKAYKDLVGILEKENYHVFAPDLPGFDTEPLKNRPLNLDDYVRFVANFIKKRKLSKVILIGHSFGGRIAVKFAAKFPGKVDKLILSGAPIIRGKTLKRKLAPYASHFGNIAFKFAPWKFRNFARKIFYQIIGEWDYYKAGKLAQTFKNIIEEDLVQYIRNVTVPVLLLWGRDDKVTPPRDIPKIRRYLSQAQSVQVQDVGHKFPYQNPKLFVQYLLPYIRGH